MPSLLFCLALVGSVLRVVGEFYQVADPNYGNTCTERCSSTDTQVNWRCDEVVDASSTSSQVCNTIIESTDNTCHYHFLNVTEVGECLNDNNMDFLFLGASYSEGMLSTVFPWFDKTIQEEETLDVVAWLGMLDDGFEKDSLGTYYLTNLVAGQENINAEGEIVWKGGASFSSFYDDVTPYSTVLGAANTNATTTNTSALTFIYAKSFVDANSAFDALAAAGRSDRKAYVVISLGAWWYYCWSFKGDYCTAFDEGSEVSALGSNWEAVQANLQGYYTTFLERLKADFPNYAIVTSDYAFDRDASTALEPLSTMLKELGDEYGYFLDIYALTHGENAPVEVGGHPLHQTNMAAWQRVLSVACKDLPSTTGTTRVECAEEVVMSSTCQYNTALETAGPAEEALSWSYQWMRPCDFVTYQSASTISVSGSSNDGGDGSGEVMSTTMIAIASCAGLVVVVCLGLCVVRIPVSKGSKRSQEAEAAAMAAAAAERKQRKQSQSNDDIISATAVAVPVPTGVNAPLHSSSV